MATIRNLIVMACVATFCPGSHAQHCFKVDMDGGALGGDCGYAPEVKIFAGPGYNFSQHSWIASKGIPTESVAEATMLDSPEDCQFLCATTPGCSYFSFEPARLCVLKEPYADMMACGTYYKDREGITSGPGVCPNCFKEHYDFGAVGGECGYAPEVKIYAKPSYTFSDHSWIADKGIPTEHVAEAAMLDSAADCQSLCMQTSDCEYFAFDPMKLCVLKKAYTDMKACLPHYKYKVNTTAGPSMCKDCISQGYDIAGGNNICGYAKEIIMYGAPGYDFSQHSWLETKGIPTQIEAKLQTVKDCKMMCEMHSNCGYYVYNYKSKGIARCLLKEAYGSPLCAPLHKESALDISGTAYCPAVKTTCSKVKSFYQDAGCCGNPSKEIANIKF